jgi:hypothetical protein
MVVDLVCSLPSEEKCVAWHKAKLAKSKRQDSRLSIQKSMINRTTTINMPLVSVQVVPVLDSENCVAFFHSDNHDGLRFKNSE